MVSEHGNALIYLSPEISFLIECIFLSFLHHLISTSIRKSCIISVNLASLSPFSLLKKKKRENKINVCLYDHSPVLLHSKSCNLFLNIFLHSDLENLFLNISFSCILRSLSFLSFLIFHDE